MLQGKIKKGMRKILPVHVVHMEDEVRGSQVHGGNLRMRAGSGGESGRWALYSTTSDDFVRSKIASIVYSLARLAAFREGQRRWDGGSKTWRGTV
jgi:hypothetical protein